MTTFVHISGWNEDVEIHKVDNISLIRKHQVPSLLKDAFLQKMEAQNIDNFVK